MTTDINQLVIYIVGSYKRLFRLIRGPDLPFIAGNRILFFFCVLYCSLFLYCTVSSCDVRAATLTEVFPCFSPVVRQIGKGTP
jgi:hypothetical protein